MVWRFQERRSFGLYIVSVGYKAGGLYRTTTVGGSVFAFGIRAGGVVGVYVSNVRYG